MITEIIIKECNSGAIYDVFTCDTEFSFSEVVCRFKQYIRLGYKVFIKEYISINGNTMITEITPEVIKARVK